uniref:Uncharacterized protein n=1 Tax=Wuchereria bancrofti TaxID=6293 RepID=A0A1I8F0A8_WUCBA
MNKMSTTINKATAIVDSTDFDEETWLIEPPNLSSTQSNSTQESGRIVEWLQGAAMNVDFQTRSALSRKLASQAARKIEEEMMEMNQIYGDKDDKDDLKRITPKWNDNNSVNKKFNKKHWEICYEGKQQQQYDSSTNSSTSLLSSDSSLHESRQVRQVNTARVPPMIAQNHVSQRSSVLDKSKSSYRSAKSHSPSTQPDLKDIKSIVERQEAELREELSRLKSSVQGDIASKTFSSCARNSQVQSTRRGTIPLASSRSTEFHANDARLSAVSIPSSRLPTPVRKSLGRSLIPTPRASALTRSTIRGLAGGSTPSLALSAQHLCDDTHSECGGMSHNEQRWADECF